MSKEPKISVIVPVYKAEKYLHKCVDSLLAQTFTDFEILLIDDGSPDKSGEICDEYAEKDSRIRVFHKENGGVSSARQCGLDNARGEYVIHADPDDWVEANMLEELYAKAKEVDADMVICDYWLDFHSKSICARQEIFEESPNVILRKLLRQELHGSCCNKLVRTSLFAKYDISFPVDIIRWEDLFVICNLLLHNINVFYIPLAFYHYNQYSNNESIIRKPSMEGVKSQIRFCNYFQSILTCIEYREELFMIKKATKELMYSSKMFSNKELRDIYSDINEEYICRYGHFEFSYKYFLSLIFQNKDLQALIYSNLYWKLISLKCKFKLW